MMRAWLGLLALLLLGACATPAEKAAEADLGSVTVSPGEGLVALRVTMNDLGPAALRGAEIRLLSETDKREWFMRSRATPNAGSAIFVRALPPGRYVLRDLARWNIRSPLTFFAFDVRAGEITDLGAAVLVYETAAGVGGRFRVAYLPSPEDSDAVLAALDPELKKRITRVQRLAIPADVQRAHAELVRLGKAHSTIQSRSHLVPGKPLAFGRALGMVSVWDPSTLAWTHLDTGSAFAVQSVCFGADGTLYAGLEEGVLVAYDGARWRRLPPPAISATILYLGQASSGDFFAVVQDRVSQKVLTTRAPESGSWVQIHELPLYAGTFGLPSPVTAGLSRTHLAVLHHQSDATLHVFDLAARTWQVNPTREVPLPNSVLEDGSIVSLGGIGLSPVIVLSQDWGKSWSRKPLERGSYIAAFRSPTVGYVAVTKGSATQIRVTRNAGDTWEDAGSVPASIQQLHVLPKEGWLMATDAVSNMYVSRDDGKTWALQRSVVRSTVNKPHRLPPDARSL